MVAMSLLGISSVALNFSSELSNFDVDSSGGDGSLNANSTYSKWNWILIRHSKTSKWQVYDWGF
jgi:hypothetical protein